MTVLFGASFVGSVAWALDGRLVETLVGAVIAIATGIALFRAEFR